MWPFDFFGGSDATLTKSEHKWSPGCGGHACIQTGVNSEASHLSARIPITKTNFKTKCKQSMFSSQLMLTIQPAIIKVS